MSLLSRLDREQVLCCLWEQGLVHLFTKQELESFTAAELVAAAKTRNHALNKMARAYRRSTWKAE